MNYAKEICKVTDNQLVFPIKDYENIGDSLSSINYNFNVLDVYTCNFEYSANNIWNNVYNFVNANSSNWLDVSTTVTDNSACWNDTYNTVSSLSSLWLKPISIIYPYPFNISDDGGAIISDITAWLNETFPVLSNNCTNFIVGQEFYVFTPLYTEINRILTRSKTIGTKKVKVKFTYHCIGSGNRSIVRTGSVNCGGTKINIAVPDKFVDNFTGLKFIVNPNSLAWQFDSALYN